MQRPTCVDTRVRSTKDAQKIIYAAYLGRLPAAHRRLDGEERAALRSGHSYAWEEKPNNQHTGQGMERWTEGKKWGPSRVRDDFLFYYEQWVSPSNLPPGASKDPPRGWEGLTKQTYSIQMKTPQGERKWHLNTYFTQATLDALGTIDDIPGVGDLVIPEGFMFSTKKSNKKSESKAAAQGKAPSDAKGAVSAAGPSRTYAAYPAPAKQQQPPVAGPSTLPSTLSIPGPSTLPIPGPAPSSSPVSPTSPTSAGGPMLSPSSASQFTMPHHMGALSLSSGAIPIPMPMPPPPFPHLDPPHFPIHTVPAHHDPSLAHYVYPGGGVGLSDPALVASPASLSPSALQAQQHVLRRASIDSSASRAGSLSGSGSSSDDSGYASVGLSTPSSTYSAPRALLSPALGVGVGGGAFHSPLPYPPARSSSSSLAHALGIAETPGPPVPVPGPGPSSSPSDRKGRDKTLAPLSTLRRPHPYKREPLDDKTLRKLETRGAQ